MKIEFSDKIHNNEVINGHCQTPNMCENLKGKALCVNENVCEIFLMYYGIMMAWNIDRHP